MSVAFDGADCSAAVFHADGADEMWLEMLVVFVAVHLHREVAVEKDGRLHLGQCVFDRGFRCLRWGGVIVLQLATDRAARHGREVKHAGRQQQVVHRPAAGWRGDRAALGNRLEKLPGRFLLKRNWYQESIPFRNIGGRELR